MSVAALLWLAILCKGGGLVDARAAPRQELQKWSAPLAQRDDQLVQIHRLLNERNSLYAEIADKERFQAKRRKFLASLEPEANLNLNAESSENEIEENDVMGADLLGDAVFEQEMRDMPRKFTLHCFGFLLTILLAGALCQYVSIRLTRAKNQDSQLKIMMKRQILESPAFQNSLQHYENNICVQYASEEEYMAIMRLKEQQRQNIKARLERERNDSFKRMQQLQTITEQSHEDSNTNLQESLLMQSILADEGQPLSGSFPFSETSNRKDKKKDKKRHKSSSRTSKSTRKDPKEGPLEMSFEKEQQKLTAPKQIDCLIDMTQQPEGSISSNSSVNTHTTSSLENSKDSIDQAYTAISTNY